MRKNFVLDTNVLLHDNGAVKLAVTEYGERESSSVVEVAFERRSPTHPTVVMRLRYDDYDDVGDTTNYKASFNSDPSVRELRRYRSCGFRRNTGDTAASAKARTATRPRFVALILLNP